MCSTNPNKGTPEEVLQENNAEAAEEAQTNENSSAGTLTDSSSDDEAPPCNPEADDSEVEAEIDVLREQSIGNTVYSKRFVLTQLMKLLKREYELDDEFESNLSLLWDMTREHDVVKFMAENNAVEIFREVAELADNLRLIEISVGIVANMCVLKTVLDENREELPIFLHMFSCVDVPTLIQLMRLYHTIFELDDTNNNWLEIIAGMPDFVDQLSHILSNSKNKKLTSDTLNMVRSMLQRFDAYESQKETQSEVTVGDIFIKNKFVQSVFDSYEFLNVSFPTNEEFKNSTDTEYDIYEVAKSFYTIHCILMQYCSISKEVYTEFMPILLREMTLNLTDFLSILTKITWPMNFVEELVLCACEIYVNNMYFGFHCDRDGFKRLLEIWDFIHFQYLEENESFETEENDEQRIIFEGLDESVLKCLTKLIDKCGDEELLALLLEQDALMVKRLQEVYEAGDEADRKRAENITLLLETDKNKQETTA